MLGTCAYIHKFFFKNFDVDHLKKSILNSLQCCFYFMLWFFGPQAYGIIALRPGIEPNPPALEGEVLNHRTSRELRYIFF